MTRIRVRIVLLTILAAAAAWPACMSTRSAFAGPYEDGVAAVDRRDYPTAAGLLRPLADSGDVRAQRLIMFLRAVVLAYRGERAQALEILRPLAEGGEAHAQSLLGTIYKEGSGVPADYAMAANWLRRAANQGDAIAQIHLADLYRRGVGVAQNSIEAYVWAGLAAINPSALAQDREQAAQYRDGYSRFLSPAEIEAAQKRIREWKPKPE